METLEQKIAQFIKEQRDNSKTIGVGDFENGDYYNGYEAGILSTLESIEKLIQNTQ